MKKYLFSVFVLFCFIFLGINDVKAEEIETSDGYAKCIYTGVISEQNPPSPEEAYRTSVSVAIRVYRDSDGVVRSYANLMASDTYLASWNGVPNLYNRQILNYEDLFYHASDKLFPTFGEGGWKCPKYIWVDINPENPAAGSHVYLNNSNGGSSLALNSNFSETASVAGTFNSDEDYEAFIESTDIGIPEGEISVTPGGEHGGTGTKVDPGTITEWAQNNGYDNIDSLGDPCSIINGNLKDILNFVFWLISIGGIILIVVMTALDFIKAIVGSDDAKLKDAFSHLITRIIVVIILLLLPMLLNFIITLVNNSSTGQVQVGPDGDIFCDVTK